MTSSASTIHSRSAYRLCLLAGILILALTVISTMQGYARPCGGLQEGYAPIIAFELARSEADLRAIFGAQADACRAEVIAHMDAINRVDALVFIPAYALFIACFFVGIRSRNEALARLGVQLAIVAAAADYVEDACLLNLTPELNAASGWFKLLPWASAAKWLALGAAAAVTAWIYARARDRRAWHIGLALVCAAASLISVGGIAAPATFGPYLSSAIGASWLVYLIVAARESLRPAGKPTVAAVS